MGDLALHSIYILRINMLVSMYIYSLCLLQVKNPSTLLPFTTKLSNNVRKKMKLYGIAVTASRIIMLITPT